MSSDDIFHYGVKGMRWGVRRSQSEAKTRLGKKMSRAKDAATRYKLSDAGAKDNLSPSQYARYSTSDARRQQKARVDRLKKSAIKEGSKYMAKHLNEPTFSNKQKREYGKQKVQEYFDKYDV